MRILPIQRAYHYQCEKHGDTGDIMFQINHGFIPITKQYCIVCYDEMVGQFCKEVTRIEVDLP